MTIQEAIRILKENHSGAFTRAMETKNENYEKIQLLDCDAFNMAIKALEKQIPKKPYFSGDGYWYGELVYDTWQCPNCDKDYEVDYEKYDYCPNCGQKLDWSDTNE